MPSIASYEPSKAVLQSQGICLNLLCFRQTSHGTQPPLGLCGALAENLWQINLVLTCRDSWLYVQLLVWASPMNPVPASCISAPEEKLTSLACPLLGMYCSTSHFCSALYMSSLQQSTLIDNRYDSDMKVVGVGLLQCDDAVIWYIHPEKLHKFAPCAINSSAPAWISVAASTWCAKFSAKWPAVQRGI